MKPQKADLKREDAQGHDSLEWLRDIECTFRGRDGVLQKMKGIPEDRLKMLQEEQDRLRNRNNSWPEDHPRKAE